MCSSSYYRWLSLIVASCTSCIGMKFGVSVALSIALILISISGILSSLFSLWFCLDTSLLWTDLVISYLLCIGEIWVVYTVLFVTMWLYFLKIATRGFQSVIIPTSQTKQWWLNFSKLCNMANASLSMLLYLLSAADRILLLNAIGLSILFSGTTSLGRLYSLLSVEGQP